MLIGGAAQASDLTGDVVHGVYLYPIDSNIVADLGSPMVGPGVEFVNVLDAHSFNVDVTATQIIVEWTASGSPTVATFNGVEFTDLTHPFSNAVLDAATDTPDVGFSFSNGNVFLNISGINYTTNGNITVDVNTGVPEPATWGLMMLGFGGLGAVARSRRKLATATA